MLHQIVDNGCFYLQAFPCLSFWNPFSMSSNTDQGMTEAALVLICFLFFHFELLTYLLHSANCVSTFCEDVLQFINFFKGRKTPCQTNFDALPVSGWCIVSSNTLTWVLCEFVVENHLHVLVKSAEEINTSLGPHCQKRGEVPPPPF